MHIRNSADLRKAVRAGPYAWPGGYASAYLCADGESLCPACVRGNYRLVLRAVRGREWLCPDWRVVGMYHMGEVDEPENEFCAHCGACLGEL